MNSIFKPSKRGLIEIIIVLVVAVGVGIWFVWPKSPFTKNQIAAWAKAVAELDKEIRFQLLVTAPEETQITLTAMRLGGRPTDPLDIWKKLKPLLTQKDPDAADFQEMRTLTKNLLMLADMFNAPAALCSEFETMLEEIVRCDIQGGTF